MTITKVSKMGQISIEGMRFYAYHGVYEEEQIIGNYYTVDVHIDTNFKKAAASDNVNNTINYETVFLICQAEMKKKTKLIETLSARIIKALRFQFATIQKVRINIKKDHPIPGADMSHSAVKVEESYVSKCPRCASNFICYKDETCWCQSLRLHQKTRESLKQEYKGCLCKNCLSFFAGVPIEEGV